MSATTLVSLQFITVDTLIFLFILFLENIRIFSVIRLMKFIPAETFFSTIAHFFRKNYCSFTFLGLLTETFSGTIIIFTYLWWNVEWWMKNRKNSVWMKMKAREFHLNFHENYVEPHVWYLELHFGKVQEEPTHR